MKMRGRGVRLWGVVCAVLMTTGFTATQTAGAQEAGVSMSMDRSDERLVYGEEVQVRGRVSTAEKREPVALQYASRGRGFRTLKRAQTGKNGRYSFKAKPVRSGRVRVVSAGAAASRVHPVKVLARIATRAREHAKTGRRARVAGRLRPGFPGRKVKVQLRKNGRWTTVDTARTRKKGRFAAVWRVQKGAGRYRSRVVFPGDARNARRVEKARLFVYRAGQASYYGPGLYGNRTACGQTLTPYTVGVANRWLPCGTKVTFRYRGRTVTAPVIDRGPFHGSRIWDLTYALKRKLGFGSTGAVWATK